MTEDNLKILKERDQAISSYIVTGWEIKEDNINSRQVTLKSEWTLASWLGLAFWSCFWIIGGVIFAANKLIKKKVVNY